MHMCINCGVITPPVSFAAPITHLYYLEAARIYNGIQHVERQHAAARQAVGLLWAHRNDAEGIGPR